MPITVPDLAPLLAASSAGPADRLADSTSPLALFPVRLETRFFTVDGAPELRVRIYPDKVHLDTHDPALTADEVTWGRRYWDLRWHAGDDDSRLREAWRMLAGRFGPERAAWVARALTPTNPASRPATPVDPDAALPTAPEFPDLGAPGASTRTAKVRLLPDRWVATVYAGGAVAACVTGRDIVSDLAIGPDLDAPVTVDDETPAIDDGMRWMVDFDTAEKVGMALRVPLPSSVSAVDVLLVSGVASGDQSAAVQALLDAHHYTDGLAFLPPATPTNNTSPGRSTYGAPDPRQDRSYANEWLSAPGPGSNADLATRASGVDAFSRLAAAMDGDEAAASAMTTALWPVTWGYFLAQMIGFDGSGLTVAGRDWARAHAIAHLRPGGPLPVLRCGRQPYGILPVTSLDSWTPPAADAGAVRLRDLLVSLRDVVWRPAAAGVARIGQTDDPGSDLVNVLRGGPLSSSYLVRGLMGQHFLQHLRAFLGENLDPLGFWQRLVQLTTQETARLGLGFVPALAHAAYDDAAHVVTAPLVGDPTYITDLLAITDLDALAGPVPADAGPLLKVLLRHALLREYAEAAARLLDAPATPLTQLLRDAELCDLVPDQPPTPTWQWQRSQPAPGTTVTVRERLDQAGDPLVGELKAALQVLSETDVPALERHLAGTLDATSHRLDAWVTSLATRRLAELRATQPTGVAVGGYAWLENLRPATPGPTAAAVPDEPGRLVTSPDDPGFIHAPSLNQAGAAALLRNAHLAHGGDRNSPYAIELSSARVRLAKQLFGGVRQGQPIGAMLGYTFERSLHDAGLDDLVDDFRTLAPLPGAATPTGVRRLVVDGIALAKKWRADPASVLSVMSASDARRPTAQRILDALEGAVDAAADAVNAEGAFQMMRGNLARAAGSLDAISSGQAPPPELGFVRTPRTGIGVTHRVAMVLAARAAANPAGWAARTTSPRAQADPALDAWAGRLLGPATGVSARVEELGTDGAVVATHEVPLADLRLAPIDLVWATGGADGAPQEIVQRVLDAAVHASGGPSPTASLRVDLGRAGPGRSLGDLVEIATRAQRLLAGARPLDGADLQPPHADPVRGLDLDELERRVSAAEKALAKAQTALTTALASGADLRAPLLGVAAFGVPGAVPSPGNKPAQARALLTETARRLASAATSRAAPPPTDDEARRDRLLARLRAVFGPGFLALPRFTAANAADVSASLADAGALRGDDPLAAYTWMQRMERVRTPLARLGRPLREAEVLGGKKMLDLSIAQVPHVVGQRWVGLDVPDGGAVTDGCASLVLQGVPAKLAGKLCGLLVDEWTELVPSRTETTGIAFQYDPPDNAAPQAILLAVPPVVGEPWTVRSLNRVLLETLDLARLRAVDPAALGDVAHYLPATYLAFNVDAEAVSSDLNPLAP
jgi:hypothetical protein